MTTSSLDERVRTARTEIDNYESTVQAIAAFRQYLVGHDGRHVQFNVGRRMNTSSENVIRPDGVVTPDIVTQLHNDYGIAVEVKRSMPSDRTMWEKTFRQLRKYDDDLLGWWTKDERVAGWNAALLIHVDYSRPVVHELVAQEGALSPGPRSVVIEFSRDDAAQPVIRFRLEHGTLAEARLLDLTDGARVPLSVIISPLAFYDSRPPKVYLANKVWDWAYGERFDRGYQEAGHKAWVVPTRLSELVRELQRAYGSGQFDSDPRSCEFPQTRWLKETLVAFVAVGLARETTAGDYECLIQEPPKGDVLTYLVRKLRIGEAEATEADDGLQASLLDLLEEEDEG